MSLYEFFLSARGCIWRIANLFGNVIHWQVQLEPTTQWALLRKDVYGPSKYTGMLQATKDIFREEGLRV